MSIFTSKKSLEIFVKKSMEKIWSKKDKEIKVCPPCHLGLIIMYDRSLKLHNFKLVSKEKYRLMPNVAAAIHRAEQQVSSTEGSLYGTTVVA